MAYLVSLVPFTLHLFCDAKDGLQPPSTFRPRRSILSASLRLKKCRQVYGRNPFDSVPTGIDGTRYSARGHPRSRAELVMELGAPCVRRPKRLDERKSKSAHTRRLATTGFGVAAVAAAARFGSWTPKRMGRKRPAARGPQWASSHDEQVTLERDRMTTGRRPTKRPCLACLSCHKLCTPHD